MDEITNEFRIELQSLLDRYKNKLSTSAIMRIAQPIFTKTIGFKDNPHRFQGLSYAKGFPVLDELEDYKRKCSWQEIAEADCDGDIKKCKCACHKGESK